MYPLKIKCIGYDTPDEHYRIIGYYVENGVFEVVAKIITIDDIK